MAQLKTNITLTVNAGQADNAMKQLRTDIKNIDKELKSLEDTGKGRSDRAKHLKRMRASINSVVRETITGAQRVESAINNLSGTSIKQLRAARNAAVKFRDSLAENDPRMKTAQANIDKINGQINKLTGSVGRNSSMWRNAVKNITAYVGVFGAFNMIKSKMQELINLNMAYSDQLADIRKVSGLTISDVNKLSDKLAKIDTRTSLQDLGKIAYSGAKLGFGNYGIEGLEQFTKAANVVNVALKEDLGEDALTALSKITENMGLIKNMGVEQAMVKTGSAMFKLAATSTASANNIVEFTKRLVPMAKAAHVTTDELLALGSASDASFLMPEVAATAFSKFMAAMQTNHNLIEKTFKIPEGTINNLYKTGHIMDAMVLVFEKMKGKNMNALKPIMPLLGSDGARLINVLVAMGNNVEMLKTHLNTSKEAFNEGRAVIDEYNIQQNTANALRERANNLWAKALVNPEEVDVVHDFAQAWYDFSKNATENVVLMGALKLSISAILYLLQSLLYVLPYIMLSLSVAGIVRGWQLLSAAIMATTFSTTGLKAAWASLNLVMKASIIGAITAAVVFLASWIYDLCTKTNQLKDSFTDLKESLQQANIEFEIGRRRAEELTTAINKAGKGTKERSALIRTFNKEFGQYISNMITETSTAYDLAKAYKEVCNNLQGKLYLESMQNDMKKIVSPRIGWEVQKLGRVGGMLKSAGSKFDASYVKDIVVSFYNAGKSIKDVMRYFNGKLYTVSEWFTKTYLNAAPLTEEVYQGYLRSKTPILKNNALYWVIRDYAKQAYSTRYHEKKVKNAYAPYDDEINSYLNSNSYGGDSAQDQLNNNANDKSAIAAKRAAEAAARRRQRAAAAAARKEEQKRQQELRDQFENAKEQATAVIASIEEYYTLQQNAVEQMYLDGQVSRMQADNLILFLKKKKEEMLQHARLAIVGRENKFNDLRDTMGWGVDRLDVSSNSDASMAKIKKANPKATGDVLRNFDGKGNTPDGSAVLDEVAKNAAENQKRLLDVDVKIKQSIDQYLKEGKFLLQAREGLLKQFIDLGMIFERPEKYFMQAEEDKAYQDGTKTDDGIINMDTVTVTAKGRKTPFDKMLDQFIKEGPKHFGIDMESDAGVDSWLKSFVSNGEWEEGELLDIDKADWISAFPDLQKWVDDIPTYKTQIQGFYMSLMQYEEEYYESRKKAYDRDKKLTEQRWERSDRGETYDRMISDYESRKRQEKLIGRGNGWWKEAFQREGFKDSIAGDPEIMKIKLQMQMMQEKLELARQVAKDEKVIREAERAANEAELAYMEAVSSAVKDRMQKLQAWTAPIEQFGDAAGKAFATMTNDAKKGRQELGDTLRSMGEQFGKLTIKMITEQITMRLQRKLFNRQMEIEELRHGRRMEVVKSKEHRNLFSKIGKFFLSLFKSKKKNQKKEITLEKEQAATQTAITETAGNARLDTTKTVETGIANISEEMGNKTTQVASERAATNMATTATETEASVASGVAGGSAKTIGTLGWWGIPLVAVITALLNGLLAFALSKLGKGSKSEKASTNTKLVTGMLTYDSGNLQAFKGIEDGRSYPVVGDDGKVYAATHAKDLATGLISDPITTLINGQPALVAERGPEIVIGRETTAAVMMSRPDILRDLLEIDRNRSGRTYRAYDSGNISERLPIINAPQSSITPEMIETLTFALNMFCEQTKKPLRAEMNKWEVVREVKKGLDFKDKYNP